MSARLGKPFFKHCLTKFNQELPLSLAAQGQSFVSVKVIASDVRIERRPPSSSSSSSFPHSSGTFPHSYAHGSTSFPHSSNSFPHSSNSFPHGSHSHYEHEAQSRFLDLDQLKEQNDGLQPFLVFKINFKIKFILKWLNLDYINVGKCDVRFGRLKIFSYCGLIRKAVNGAVQQMASDMNEIHTPNIIRQLQQILRYRIGEEIAIPLLLAEEKGALLESLVEKANNIASLKADLVGDLNNLVGELNNG